MSAPSMLSLNNALSYMRSGARLMLMHVNGGGQEFFMVPGGRVTRQDAQEIIDRVDVQPFDDGLFPGNPQSWKMGQMNGAAWTATELFGGLPDLPALIELKSRARWVAWRYETRNGKLTKPPINPRTGGYASTADPATWGAYAEASHYARANGLPGVGYVLGEDDGDLTGIDLDKCINGTIDQWALDILALNESYAEVSPSGTGIRIIARGKIVASFKLDQAGVEVYGSGRYLTITGNHIPGTPTEIRPAPQALAALRKRIDDKRKEAEEAKRAASNSAGQEESIRPQEQPRPGRRGVLWTAIFGTESDPFFRSVNSAALQSLPAWVPTLFGAAAKPSSKGYRVSSADLGRELEEDLSFTAQGIKDFGVHDMGDANDGRRTPIDIVLEYGEPETAADAALWLCERLGIDPASLGWRSGTQNDQGDARSEENASPEQPPPITKLTDWLTRDLPKPDLVQGEIMSTTSRVLLWAPTGIGKTMWGIASAMAMAAGHDFIGWRGHRPRRVLYIDGEMSRVLLQERLRDEAKRLGVAPENFHALSHEDIEGFAPLNTPEGQKQIEREIARINPEFIYFDNIMSLTGGVMKEEESWRQIMPWVLSLTRRCIGQLWIHHTGHDESKGYGTKTREWHMDTVIGLSGVKRDDTDVSFKLTFYKKRLCTPANRADFVEKNVALINDRWVYSEAGKAPSRISPMAEKFLAALINATIGNEANKMFGCPAASLGAWQGECVKQGLLEREKGKITLDHTSRTRFSKCKLELITANRIACNDTMAWMP